MSLCYMFKETKTGLKGIKFSFQSCFCFHLNYSKIWGLRWSWHKNGTDQAYDISSGTMAENYPCKICHKECVLDTIQCDFCCKWIHTDCVPMSAAKLKSWSQSNLQFLCKECCFYGGIFDFKKSLERYVLLLLIVHNLRHYNINFVRLSRLYSYCLWTLT